MRPMQIAFTRIFSAAYSLARDLVRFSPAERITLVGSAFAAGALPPPMEALTMAPPPRLRISGTQRRHMRTAAKTFS